MSEAQANLAAMAHYNTPTPTHTHYKYIVIEIEKIVYQYHDHTEAVPLRLNDILFTEESHQQSHTPNPNPGTTYPFDEADNEAQGITAITTQTDNESAPHQNTTRTATPQHHQTPTA